METVKESSGASPTPRRVIKRYSNRKLYDTQDSKYVTLQQIGQMVRAGEEVQIIDNATKEDKTEVTLALIISEDLKSQPRSVPLGTLRDLIQERGERLLSQLREGPIGRLIPGGVADGALPPEPPPSPEPVKHDSERPAGAKARLTEIMESSRHTLDQWQQTIDERIRAILPGFVLFRELEAEVKALSQRVSELEAELQKRADPSTGSQAPPQDKE